MSKSNAKKSASREEVQSGAPSAEPVVRAVVDSPLAQQPEKASEKPKKAAADKAAAKAEKTGRAEKTVKADKGEKADKSGKAPKPEKNDVVDGKDKPKKAKLVRDSFTIPEAEYKVLAEVKRACLKAGFEVKKSELIRIGLALVQETDPLRLQQVLAKLPSLKAGRPKKNVAQA